MIDCDKGECVYVHEQAVQRERAEKLRAELLVAGETISKLIKERDYWKGLDHHSHASLSEQIGAAAREIKDMVRDIKRAPRADCSETELLKQRDRLKVQVDYYRTVIDLLSDGQADLEARLARQKRRAEKIKAIAVAYRDHIRHQQIDLERLARTQIKVQVLQ